ncbi:unnamed protein product [Rhodiola kirilowii]
MFRYHLIFVIVALALQNMFSLPDDPEYGYRGEERDALLALRDSFNDTFLKKNWNGLMCYMNNPPKWYGIQCTNGRVTGILLEEMGLNGSIRVDAFVNLTQLSILSFKNNLISGPLMDFSSNPKLSFIDLSFNRFDGHVHQSLTGLPNLGSLQLNENHITGHLPAFSQSSLRYFNVSYNDLTGPVPDTSVLQSFGSSSYFGNPELCGPPTQTPCSSKFGEPSPEPLRSSTDDQGKPKKLNFTTIFIIVDTALLILVLLIVFFFCKKRSRNKKQNQASIKQDTSTEPIQTPDKRQEPQIKGKLAFIDDEIRFELGDLLKASAEGLGTGNFGNTYKALLEDGPAFVVKRLRDLKPLSVQEFEKQVRLIADLQHPNLLPLIAFYTSRDEKLMIYTHIQSGNLFNRIQGRRSKNRIPFRWSSRLTVARGVAKAVEYLHFNTKSAQAVVPHGNLKTTNILLGADDTPLVTDYGLTALISIPIAAQRMVSYKSPEYQTARKLTKKSDVWCLGIVLMELLTGRVSVHSATAGMSGVDLCSWVHRAVREEWTAEIFDTEIAVQRSAAQGMLRVLKLAMRCCDKSPDKRPEIGEVVRELESLKTPSAEEEGEDDVSDDVSGTDRSLTDESYCTTASGAFGEEKFTRFKILDRSVCYSIRVCVRRSRNEKSARFAGDEVFISVRRIDTQMTDKRKTGKKKKKKGKRNGCVMSGEQACALRAVQEWVFLGNGGDSVGGSLEVDGEFNVVKCGGGGRLGEKMVFELHCHSICSDGFLSPTRVVERAYENGVKVLALTDHDTMSGIPEALVAARKLGIKIIPGVEISTMFSPRDNSEAEEPVHILAYYSSCGPTRPEELEEFLASIRDGRYVRAQNMISKLNSLKMPVKWEHVARIAGKGVAPGRVHVARAMLEAGHVENLKQAFSRYLHDNGPAYSKGSEPLAEDTVRMIRNTGGVAVLAHPWALKNPASVIRKLKEVGLHGMEVYRCDGKLAAYSDLADACELLKLGGSDFHGKGKNSESSLGSVNMPVTVLHDFLKVARPIWRDGIMNTLEGYIVEPSEAKLQEITRFRRTKIMDPFSCKKELINSCVSSWLTKEEMQNPELEAIMLNLNNALITLESHQVAIETPPPS